MMTRKNLLPLMLLCSALLLPPRYSTAIYCSGVGSIINSSIQQQVINILSKKEVNLAELSQYLDGFGKGWWVSTFALGWATIHGKERVVELLKSRDDIYFTHTMGYGYDDPFDPSKGRLTGQGHLLFLAFNSLECFDLLLRDPKIELGDHPKDDQGNTLLHLAAMLGKEKIVALLLQDERTNHILRNNKKLTALDYAFKPLMLFGQDGFWEMAKLDQEKRLKDPIYRQKTIASLVNKIPLSLTEYRQNLRTLTDYYEAENNPICAGFLRSNGMKCCPQEIEMLISNYYGDTIKIELREVMRVLACHHRWFSCVWACLFMSIARMYANSASLSCF